jgi:hypothetical protein
MTTSRKNTRGHDTPAASRPGDSPSAREHYTREKARRARTPRPESEAMAAARREYEAMLAAGAVKGKGGRPKKNVASPPAGSLGQARPESDESDAGEE